MNRSIYRSKTLKIQIMNLSPLDANFILQKVRGGRDSCNRRKEIDLYKKIMLEGKWTIINTIVEQSVDDKLLFPFHDFLCEPLMFLRDGTLYEGRNRMIALSELKGNPLKVPFIVLLGMGESDRRAWNKWHKWSVENGYRKTQFQEGVK